MLRRAAALAALPLLALPAAGQEGSEPLSAIDWLSHSVEAPPVEPDAPPEAPVAEDASAPGITVTPLGASPGAVGVLPSAVTGLPRSLWSASDEATLLALIAAPQAETLPALQDLLVTLMLAEAEPPAGSDPQGPLFLARVDRLLALGEVEAAQSLLESADLLDPATFRRWFDATLLTGTEGEACDMLRTRPSLAPTLEARVFCLARNGDWNSAALTLNTARALGDVTPEDEALLARFLDPELFDGEEEIGPPTRPTPLVYRLREAVGDLLPTGALPLAFAFLDLRPIAAWRAQIEAAERLARRDALAENVLLAIYTARAPAASGGVWDRAAAVQRLDRAIAERDTEAVAATLPSDWARMEEAGLAVPFARLFGEALVGLPLDGEAARAALRAGLLSPAAAEAARAFPPTTPRERVWQAVATGEAEGVEAPDAASAAVLQGFSAEPPEAMAALLAEGRVGEAALRAIADFERGLDGDHGAIAGAIATLRAAGLEGPARQAALQFLILDARR